MFTRDFMMALALAAFELERRPNETCKTSRHRIATKFRMHLIGSLIKANLISEVLMHGRFFEIFFKNHGKLAW